jgi:poly(3-hydroxybutyrate) depolymerase
MSSAGKHCYPGALESQSVPKILVIILLWLAAAGCTPALTDVTTVSGPGRYEVSFAGSGVTLGGILFRPASRSKPLPAIIVLHGWARPGAAGSKARRNNTLTMRT